jgi:nucleosome binding factor SPN SPT16 subunit
MMKKVSKYSSKVLSKFVQATLEDYIKVDKAIKNSSFASKIEDFISEPNPKIFGKPEIEGVDPCFLPIIQSGEKYSLDLDYKTNDDSLDYHVIVSIIGCKYEGLCSLIGRTFIFTSSSVIIKLKKGNRTKLSSFGGCL